MTLKRLNSPILPNTSWSLLNDRSEARVQVLPKYGIRGSRSVSFHKNSQLITKRLKKNSKSSKSYNLYVWMHWISYGNKFPLTPHLNAVTGDSAADANKSTELF